MNLHKTCGDELSTLWMSSQFSQDGQKYKKKKTTDIWNHIVLSLLHFLLSQKPVE